MEEKEKESKLSLPVASELCPWIKKEKREERKSYQSLSEREKKKKNNHFCKQDGLKAKMKHYLRGGEGICGVVPYVAQL